MINTDICIIGGGPAAIAIARELSGSKLQVCILESGGMGLESENQAFAAGTTSGLPYFPLEETRYRMLGGSTYRWGARSAPMLDIDFQTRPWIPMSGWPITREELSPYYQRVENLAGWHVPFQYDERVWDGFEQKPPPFDRDKLRFSAFQFGKIILFGDYYKKLLQESSNTHVYLHAYATNLHASTSTDHIEYVEVRTMTGRVHHIRAQCFVLAAGGIENARLLLLSNGVNSKGLCNDYDIVGRYFMEHPTLSVGGIKAENWQALQDVFSPGMLGGRLVEVGLALTPEIQASQQCNQAITRTQVVAKDDSTQALRELIWSARHRKLPGRAQWYIRNPFITERLERVMRDPLGIVSNLVRHAVGKPKRFKIDSMYLEARIEQEPNADSRVTLGNATDPLGQRRAHLCWSLSERDRHTVGVAARMLANEFQRLGLCEFQMAPWLMSDDGEWPSDMVGGHHHMGTTRMSESAKTGIVNRDCRTHAIDNLYIAGSSVFSTSSYVNPTPTLLALAIRLAEHLSSKLG